MPSSPRQKLRRRIAYAHADISRAIDHLGMLHEAFERSDAKYCKAIELACLMLNHVLTMIDRFCQEAWGRAPKDYEKWRNTRERLTQAEDMK